MMILILHLFLKHGKTFTHKCFYTLMILQLSGQPSGSADQGTSGSADQQISGPNQEIHGSACPRILQSAISLYLSTAFHTRAFLPLIAGSFSKKLYL